VRLNVASAASTVHNLRIEISRYDFFAKYLKSIRRVSERSRQVSRRKAASAVILPRMGLAYLSLR
jgi:hypothetical protein